MSLLSPISMKRQRTVTSESSSVNNQFYVHRYHQQPSHVLEYGHREVKTERATFVTGSPTIAPPELYPQSALKRGKRQRSDSTSDSGLGSSFFSPGSMSQESMCPNGSVLKTPKCQMTPNSGGTVMIFGDSLVSPMSRSENFASPVTIKTETDAVHWPETLRLSNSKDSSQYRFNGQKLESLGGKGLVKIGSPETAYLSTPKQQKRFLRCQSESLGSKPVVRSVMPRTASENTQPVCLTPPKFGSQTPSKMLPFSPTHGMSGPNDFLGGFAALNTSTPVRDMCLNDGLSTMASTSQQPDCQTGSLAAVIPSSMTPEKRLTVHKGNLVPRTPTPFKKALAALERKSGRIDNTTGPDVQDMHEFILKDSGVAAESVSSQSLLDGCATKSKSTVSIVSVNMSNENNEVSIASVNYPVGDFLPPDRTPDKRSAEWMEITCGKTSSQVQLTEMAKEFLGMSS